MKVQIPAGASLSDILFLFVLEKYIVCDVCGLRSPVYVLMNHMIFRLHLYFLNSVLYFYQVLPY